MPAGATDSDVAQVQDAGQRLQQSVGRVVVGLEAAVELVLVALLTEGHVLLEDVPGVGKTLLARTFARCLSCTFRRLQCTPDLLPADVTGLSFFNQRSQGFEFRPGPIFTQILLADEINRATPRAQAAMLEGMEERQVTVEGETRPLPRPFLVLATQNPVELEGTFPLPEAQLDRFLLRLTLGYPGVEEETAILAASATALPWRAPSRCWKPATCCGCRPSPAGCTWGKRWRGIWWVSFAPRAGTRPWTWALRPGPRWPSTAQRRPWRPSGAAPTSCRTTSSTWPRRCWAIA